MGKNGSTLLKLVLAVGVLTLIVGIAIYTNVTKVASGDNVAAFEQAILGGQAKAYGVNECAKPVILGTNMTDPGLRFYFAYHITATNFTSGPPNYTPKWYTCPVFNVVYNTMKKQNHASLLNLVNTMETGGGNPTIACDVPSTTDAPASYCGAQRPV